MQYMKYQPSSGQMPDMKPPSMPNNNREKVIADHRLELVLGKSPSTSVIKDNGSDADLQLRLVGESFNQRRRSAVETHIQLSSHFKSGTRDNRRSPNIASFVYFCCRGVCKCVRNP